MKNSILTLVILFSVLLFSCKKEEPVVPNITTNNGGTVQYTGDNILGYWVLDSVFSVSTTYVNWVEIIDTNMLYNITDNMEIYYEDDYQNKQTTFPNTGNSAIEVERTNMVLGRLLWMNTLYDGDAYADSNGDEMTLYGGNFHPKRYYEITDIGTNNQLIVWSPLASNGSTPSLIEYWHRVQ